ncbi:MAG: diaminobutyrate--2-oxoglutarate transaminase [Alphaproteobacteria bacterium]
MEVIEKHESKVRAYCRNFPALFDTASGARLRTDDGREYIDFFSGAGALNYGHNPPDIKRRLIEYLESDGIVHGLDMATTAKERFIERFHDVILAPRGMKHKMLFPGPTGTNAVEAAIKLARLATGREGIVGFTNAFHGMTLGALALTGDATKREGAGIPLAHVVRMPYADYLGDDMDTLAYLERCLKDDGSGVDLPAAVIVETIQGEGGLNAASFPWLRRLEKICRRHGMLLIVDDIQAGCGRTGPFFSFEPAGIEPDIVCLSKSLGVYGLPLAVTLVKPEYDRFSAGQHNGTFRGNNLAFVAATEALSYWENDDLSTDVTRKAAVVRGFLCDLVKRHDDLDGARRGRGLMQGVAFEDDGFAQDVCAAAFERGLLMETSGANSEVMKLMPPLTIDDTDLKEGLKIVSEAVDRARAVRRRNKTRDVA